MTTLQQYLGRFTATTSHVNFSLNDGGGADPVVLTTGEYFMAGYTGEPTEQFIEHMQTQIRAISGYGVGEAAECTISYSGGNGLISIDFNGQNVDITWTDTELQDILGYTGSQTGAAFYTATYQPRYVWRPSRALVYFPGDLTKWFEPRSTSKVILSKDGTTYTTEGNLLYSGSYAYENLTKAEVITDSTTQYESLEYFFEDCIHAVKRVRCYPDRTLNTASDYVEGYIVPPGDTQSERLEIGSFAQFRNRHIQTYNGLWDAQLGVVKHVSA